jgi:hypothetical protein
MTGAVVFTSEAEFLEHPERLVEHMRAKARINIPDLGYTTAPISEFPYVGEGGDLDEAGDMTSLRKNKTGVDNTMFISTKGYGQHGPRIKIAIDPPYAFTPEGKTASMAIHDCSVIEAYMPMPLVEQAKKFIEANRDVLLEYWDGKIPTDEMIERLKAIS